MHELINAVLNNIRGVLLYRWLIVSVAWLVCIVGWAKVVTLPDVFEARAQLYVDTDSILRPLLKGLAVESNVDTRVSLMVRTLFGQSNLEKVARMTDMDLQAQTPQEMESLLAALKKQLKLKSLGRQNLYTITYSNEDPKFAKLIVQSFLTIFVESALGDTKKDTDVAQKFLSQQIKVYEQRLEEAEDRLKKFKQKNVGLMPGSEGNYYQRLATEKQQLDAAKLELNELNNRHGEVIRQLKNEKPYINIGRGTVEQPAMSALERRIQSLQEKLDDLLSKYTDKHPNVLSLQEMIERLTKQQEAELGSEVSVNGQPANTEPNPIYQELRITLTSLESDLAAAKTRKKNYLDNVSKLEKMVNTIPQIEADLQRLDRDYELNKSNYEELLERLESAKMGESVDQSADDVKFKVIDPPRVPLMPSGPKRKIFISLTFAFSWALGIGLTFLLWRMREGFFDSHSLFELTERPVFGVVSLVLNTQMTRRRRLADILCICVILLLCSAYAGLMLIYVLRPHLISGLLASMS